MCYRLNRIKSIDQYRIQKLIEKEEKRKKKSEESLAVAKERTAYMNGEDNLLRQSTAAMTVEVDSLRAALAEAQREEEEALKVRKFLNHLPPLKLVLRLLCWFVIALRRSEK